MKIGLEEELGLLQLWRDKCYRNVVQQELSCHYVERLVRELILMLVPKVLEWGQGVGPWVVLRPMRILHSPLLAWCE